MATESIGKAFEFVGKYSWAIAIVAAFVLFIPEDAARQIGVLDFRTGYKGAWWLVLVLSFAVFLGAAFQYLDRRIFDGWFKTRADRKAKDEKTRQFMEALPLRLNSLDDREREWLRFCLINNIQSLSTQQANRVAQSLVAKGILTEGSGHIMDLPFHIPDRVWRYLLDHREDFVVAGEETDPRVKAKLEQFRKSLHPHY